MLQPLEQKGRTSNLERIQKHVRGDCSRREHVATLHEYKIPDS